MLRMYDRLASRYDRMHARWLRHAGGEAQAALEASLVTRITPGARVLDAGCGTGALARSLLDHFDGDLSLTLLDASREMLAQTADIPAERVHGSLLSMPFQSDRFDIAVACWSIEATGNESAAIAELMRVVKPGGHVLVAFCADENAHCFSARLLRKGVEMRRTGRFLDVARTEIAFRAAGATQITRHRCSGPAAVIDAQCGAEMEFARAA